MDSKILISFSEVFDVITMKISASLGLVIFCSFEAFPANDSHLMSFAFPRSPGLRTDREAGIAAGLQAKHQRVSFGAKYVHLIPHGSVWIVSQMKHGFHLRGVIHINNIQYNIHNNKHIFIIYIIYFLFYRLLNYLEMFNELFPMCFEFARPIPHLCNAHSTTVVFSATRIFTHVFRIRTQDQRYTPLKHMCSSRLTPRHIEGCDDFLSWILVCHGPTTPVRANRERLAFRFFFCWRFMAKRSCKVGICVIRNKCA